MTRSSYVTLIVGAATSAALATAAAIFAAQPPSAPATAVATSSSTESKPDPRDVSQLVGVSSCAASGCHGGSKPLPGSTEPDAQAAWRSSYVVWATSDPHARAYQTLKSPASEAIVRKLARKSADEKFDMTAIIEVSCTGCHATATPINPGQLVGHPPAETARLQSIAADGIGCESCHGPAKKWLGEHFTVRTAERLSVRAGVAKSEKERLAELGMLDTDNLKVQAETCVRCHVGDRAGDRMGRDMNHDLIAAGHPPLNFEFAAYKARMPRHWAEPKEPALRADKELRTWQVGQLTSAAAAQRLSSSRYEAVHSSTPMFFPTATWPEFSEYACYRCHHALRSGSTADVTPQQQFALARKKASQFDTAKYPLGPSNLWHRSQADAIMKPYDEAARKHAEQQQGPGTQNDEEEVTESPMRQLAARFTKVAAEIAATPSDASPRRLSELLGKTAQSAADKPLVWEEATQAYLGCVAIYRARRAASGLPLDKIDDESGRILKQLYGALRFDKPGERRFNSPADYDPAAIQGLFEKLAAAAREGVAP